MESNIDPEINAATDANGYVDLSDRSPYAKSNENDHESGNDDHIDHLAVDTATLLLKVLAYQMPLDDKNGGKLEKDAYAYYDAAHKAGLKSNSEHDHNNHNNNNNNNNESNDSKISALVEQVASRLPQPPRPSATSRQSNHHANNIESPLNFVMMDPSTKEGLSKRLGRPRRTLRSTETPQQSSLNNSNESVISRFRFDSIPITGAKGKIKFKNGKLPSKSTKVKTRRVIQHADGFKLVIEHPNAEHATLDTKRPHDESSTGTSPYSKFAKLQSPPTTIVVENIASLKAKGRSTAKDGFDRYRSGRTGTRSSSATQGGNEDLEKDSKGGIP